MNEVRILVASDVFLDAAWPQLGVARGARLREAAKQALLQLVESAKAREVDLLVLLGGMFDHRCVLPDTLDLMRNALDALTSDVLVIPGAADPYSDDAPYALTEWPARVQVLPRHESALLHGITFRRLSDAPQTAYVTLPVDTESSPQIFLDPSQTLPDTALGDNGAEIDVSFPAGSEAFHMIRASRTARIGDSHWSGTGRVLPLPDGGVTVGQAVALLVCGAGVCHREVLELREAPIRRVRLDLSAFSTTRALLAELDRLDDRCFVKLHGRLARGVLLPDVATDELAKRVELGAIEFEWADPLPDDRSVAAEFERQVMLERRSVQEQHEAIALGIRALAVGNAQESSEKEGAP